MKLVLSILGLALACAAPVALAAPAAPHAPATSATAVHPASVLAVQDLLAAMQAEKILAGVAGRSRYPTEAQRQAVFAKLASVPPADVYRRLAPALTPVISADTAAEMTRFYRTPYGKQVIQKRYNSGPQIMMPGMTNAVPPEEKKERKRPAYVQASKALAEAEPVIEREAFKLLQQINSAK